MKTQTDLSVAAAASVDLDRWQLEFDELMLRIGSRFARVEPRRRVAAFLRGLLAGLPRTNCWTIAEHAGDTDPRGMQRLLSQAVWDADCVRDDLRGYVTEHLGNPDAVLVVDETCDVKKGTCTVGVQRQYTGTAGRIENSQVAVYLTYATPAGYAFIDRDLYLPRSWTDDPERCATAVCPVTIRFATKPALARAMTDRALHAGDPARWAAGDEVYGADPGAAQGPGRPRPRIRAGSGKVTPVRHRDRAPPGDRPGCRGYRDVRGSDCRRGRCERCAGTTGP